jgi:hypothetical protein
MARWSVRCLRQRELMVSKALCRGESHPSTHALPERGSHLQERSQRPQQELEALTTWVLRA